ncbi:MAG TPA: DUF5676 family membrane protein [Nitrospirales bacterium]|nr:DUF5676 family membrane protein [Nitrospirales bacterium]
MPIRPLPFANALAVTTAVLAVVLLVLRAAAPGPFVFIFNAQFFGANVASLLPLEPPLVRTVAEMVAFVGGAWGFGLLGAILYNRFIETAPGAGRS